MSDRVYTPAEVAVHNKIDSCWMVIKNVVYDVTTFLDEHPGGVDIMLQSAGTDATEAFESIGHSDEASDMLVQYKIGVLGPAA